jgi:hypothetical protein
MRSHFTLGARDVLIGGGGQPCWRDEDTTRGPLAVSRYAMVGRWIALVRRDKAAIFSGCNSHPAQVAPAGSNRSGSGGNDTAEAFDGKGRLGRLREQAGRNASERRAGLETHNVGADPANAWGRPPSQVQSGERHDSLLWSHRGSGDGMSVQGDRTQHGKPQAVGA